MPAVNLNVEIGRRVVTKYEHNGLTYIEGRKGSEFVITVHNPSPTRKLVLLSVDGRSITTGLPASNSDTGYVVGPSQTLSVPGWTVNNTKIANFVFSSVRDSYSNVMGSQDTNSGVIGVMVYNEKVNTIYASKGIFRSNDQFSLGASASSSLSASANSTPVVNNLGTGFGNSAEFNTSTVDFDIGQYLGIQCIYYDDLKGLTSRGIVVNPPKAQSLPNPFPGIGCPIPPGWQG